jgi:hypothetical protein
MLNGEDYKLERNFKVEAFIPPLISTGIFFEFLLSKGTPFFFSVEWNTALKKLHFLGFRRALDWTHLGESSRKRFHPTYWQGCIDSEQVQLQKLWTRVYGERRLWQANQHAAVLEQVFLVLLMRRSFAYHFLSTQYIFEVVIQPYHSYSQA